MRRSREKDCNIFYKFLLSDCSDLTTTNQRLKISIPKEFKIEVNNFDIEVNVRNDEGVESTFMAQLHG